jgi:hypothetical protein
MNWLWSSLPEKQRSHGTAASDESIQGEILRRRTEQCWRGGDRRYGSPTRKHENMEIPQHINQAQEDYEAILPKLKEILHRIRSLRRTGRAGKENLKRIRRLELDILEMRDIFRHQGYYQ